MRLQDCEVEKERKKKKTFAWGPSVTFAVRRTRGSLNCWTVNRLLHKRKLQIYMTWSKGSTLFKCKHGLHVKWNFGYLTQA